MFWEKKLCVISINFENPRDEFRVLVASSSPDPDFDSMAFKRRGCWENGVEGAAGSEESLADDSPPPLRTSDVIQFFPLHRTVKSVVRNNATK